MKAWMAQQAGLEVEDLVQEGRCGALIAAQKFDPSRKIKFLTYAAHWINAAMGEALQHRMIRTPRGNKRITVHSYDAPLDGDLDGQGTPFCEGQADLDHDLFESAARSEAMARILRILPGLPARERDILMKHFGLTGRDPLGLSELAQEYGVSRQRISQILERTMDMVRRRGGLRAA
jgi:RNA polymerase primary sigma factor